MLKINGTTIELTQGDTLWLQFALTNSDGEPYEASPGDTCRFALAKKYGQEPIYVRNIPLDTGELKLFAEETKALKKGTYVYDVELKRYTGDVYTFIAKAKLKITEEVY